MKVCTDACLFGAWCAHEISKLSSVKKVLDIGSGTGLLSLMVAQKNKNVSIDAVEIEAAAYTQSVANIAVSPFNQQIFVHHSSIKKYQFPNAYDCIISNPPFYEDELKSAQHKKNIALHSSHLRLKELLQLIENNLSPTGIFFLLLPYKRTKEVTQLLTENKLHAYQQIQVKQSVQHQYFRIMIYGGLMPDVETKTKDIAIWNENQQYTPEFTALLKDYYLYL